MDPELLLEKYKPFLKQYSVDRKSTRLNSSHLVISYAVFCLKKKNQLESCVWVPSIVARSTATKSAQRSIAQRCASRCIKHCSAMVSDIVSYGSIANSVLLN